MKYKIKTIMLAAFLLYSAFFLIGSTLSPIMAHLHSYEISAKLTSLYMFSCHQQPDRCFWLLGYPIALCCRCLGFYLGVMVSSIVSILNKLSINLKYFIALAIICCADILANCVLTVKNISTGNITRFTIGIIMGLLFVVILQFLSERMYEKLCSKKSQQHLY